MSAIEFTAAESPIDSVRGTAERLPSEFARLIALETLLLDRFARAGYEPLRTPVLEYTELHERKSGAGIVSRLFEIAGASVGNGRVCLRPELTAGMVRAYIASEVPPELPWRVSHSGPVFRYETPKPGRLRSSVNRRATASRASPCLASMAKVRTAATAPPWRGPDRVASPARAAADREAPVDAATLAAKAEAFSS